MAKKREPLTEDEAPVAVESEESETKSRQKSLPGTQTEKEEKLDALAQDYEDIKNKRCAMSAKERDAKRLVEEYMIEHKIKRYRVNEKTLFVIEENQSLKIIKQDQDEE